LCPLGGVADDKVLLEHNAEVYIAGRSKATGAAAVEKLFHETGNGKAEVLELDLADTTSVIAAVTTLRPKE
jgi:NAD(P)-dependent dehydrogenase (short-subunit alcohol dehydrogenase family)